MCALKHLPSDLIEAILPFLPSKSLGRFKSVSKRWYSLISNPNFIKTHIHIYTENNPNPDPTHIILVPDEGDCLYSVGIKQLNTKSSRATVNAKFLKLYKPLVEILGSCNGLLLASDVYNNLCIVNPTTGEKVPVGKSIHGTTYGFGYDSFKDDYKVISISGMGVSDSDPMCKTVSVYSLRNNSWNMLTNFPYQQHDQYSHSQCPGVLLNNNLHWVVRNRRSKLTIAAFSLANEEFCEIGLPDSFNYDLDKVSRVFALGGKLVGVLCDGLLSPDNFYELWVMEEYGVHMSWTKCCVFENNMHLCFEFFAQVSCRDILLGNNDANKFFIYKMDEKRCTSVKIKRCQKVMVYGTYVESLESLKRFR
ncbi:F-box protein CPR1-like [Rutidosis leptorrhynchoides]|uniref:F-box protein CPR1-like n=1 Tax=Rutidosis leptorrhynchoides TaxID=125765 RepID=UPI003A9926F4